MHLEPAYLSGSAAAPGTGECPLKIGYFDDHALPKPWQLRSEGLRGLAWSLADLRRRHGVLEAVDLALGDVAVMAPTLAPFAREGVKHR